MKSTLRPNELKEYIAQQLSSFFPDRKVDAIELSPFVENGLERLAICMNGISDKYLPSNQEKRFNHRNTDHYGMFLYLVANTIRRLNGNIELADKTYALNKALHAIDVYYEVDLPEVFFFQHPVGTVLGRANYGNYLMVYQRCTVGAKDQVYPRIGEGVVMFGGSSIIGDCSVGNNVWLSSGTGVLAQSIPGDSVVFGVSPNIVVKPTDRQVVRDLFNHPSGRASAISF